MTHIFEIQSVNQSSCPISIDPIYKRKKKKNRKYCDHTDTFKNP